MRTTLTLDEACDRASAHRAAARRWLDERIREELVIGLPFLRITTNHKLPSPQPLETAALVVDDWPDLDNVRLVHPGERHWPILK